MRSFLLAGALTGAAIGLSACGGDDDEGGADTSFDRQENVAGCVEVWNSEENRPLRADVRKVLTFAEPPAVSVDLSARCEVIVVFEDSGRAYRYVQGAEGIDGSPYGAAREISVGSLPRALREGNARFANEDEATLARGRR